MKNTAIVILVVVVFLCLVVAGGLWLIGRQMGIHRWDDSQVPVITVSGGLQPVISFIPDAAFELSVYEGSEDKDGFDTIWYATGPGGSYENNLLSPVTYGLPPVGSEVREAPPLESGKAYTISIFRKDPKGDGDGFTNTRHRYVGTVTFVATEE